MVYFNMKQVISMRQSHKDYKVIDEEIKKSKITMDTLLQTKR